MTLRHLVVATDGSPAAEHATTVALEIAAGVDAEVTFVHGDEALARELFETDTRHPGTSERRLALDAVLNGAAAAARTRGVAAQTELVGAIGSRELVDAILGVVEAVDADMIVVGSRGRGRIAGAVLGSVSQALLEASPVPVVIVHAPR